jgi:hypothetical protein
MGWNHRHPVVSELLEHIHYAAVRVPHADERVRESSAPPSLRCRDRATSRIASPGCRDRVVRGTCRNDCRCGTSRLRQRSSAPIDGDPRGKRTAWPTTPRSAPGCEIEATRGDDFGPCRIERDRTPSGLTRADERSDIPFRGKLGRDMSVVSR